MRLRAAVVAILVLFGSAQAKQWNAITINPPTASQNWDRRVCWVHSSTAMTCINQDASSRTNAVEMYYLTSRKVVLAIMTPAENTNSTTFRRLTGVGGDSVQLFLGGSSSSGHFVWWSTSNPFLQSNWGFTGVTSFSDHWARIVGNTWKCQMQSSYDYSSVVVIDAASGNDSFCTYNHNTTHGEGAYYCTSEAKWSLDANEAINVCLDSTHLWAEARYDTVTSDYRSLMWTGSTATSTTFSSNVGTALRPGFRYSQSGVRGAYVIWNGTDSIIRTNGTSNSPTNTTVSSKDLRTGTECSISGNVRGCLLATTGELYIDDGAGGWTPYSGGDVPSGVLNGGTVQYLTGGSDQSATGGPSCWDIDGDSTCDPIVFMTSGMAYWGNPVSASSAVTVVRPPPSLSGSL